MAEQLAQAVGVGGSALELEHVARRYRVGTAQTIVALDGISLAVPAGSSLAVLGPSGSGKSTLLHVIAGLEQPDEGRVAVGGRELLGLTASGLAAHRRRVGFVFQQFNLLPALTVIDNVIAPVLPFRTGFDKRARARALLAAVGLSGRETSMPSRLSGGQQQRVAIARALINYPEVILADEPTGNLDSKTGQEIVDLLLAQREQRRTTVVIATHDEGVAERCERLIELSDGALVRDTLACSG
jgi:putative ABC transport system ATP-binding protein